MLRSTSCWLRLKRAAVVAEDPSAENDRWTGSGTILLVDDETQELLFWNVDAAPRPPAFYPDAAETGHPTGRRRG